VDINRAEETVRENIKISAKQIIGYYELKKHKPWFDERCSNLRSKEPSQIAVVTAAKKNKWG
jgi:hypothetical protein